MSENSSRTILVIGTFDTKNDELFYLSNCIQKQNGNVLKMDVSVLGFSNCIEFSCVGKFAAKARLVVVVVSV